MQIAPLRGQILKLIVLIHGWLLANKDLDSLKTLMELDHDFEGATILVFPYDASLFSNERLDNVAEKLNLFLEKQHQISMYDQISIVGHSIGGLIARKAYLLSLKNKTKWRKSLSKIILIGTPNRGSTLSQHNMFARSWMQLMEMVNQMRLIRDAFRGSQFITNLRIDWVRTFREWEDEQTDIDKFPHIIQVLCGKDFKVKPEDSLDVTQFGNVEHMVIKNVTHENAIKIKSRSEEKYTVIKDALLDKPSKPLSSRYLDKTDQTIDNVTFFMHGIRTKGHWTKKAAQILKGNKHNIDVLWPNYGYFPIARFLWGPSRQALVHWFRDEYSNAFVKHPLAEFNFVGHSNGTFILANTLTTFRSIKFNKVYFAGSVVPEDYPWSKIFDNLQVKTVRNDCAAIDLPVGFLCNGLNKFGIKKLGVGGYNGFLDKPRNLIQNRFLKVDSIDGHSVALNDANFESIRDFMLDSDTTNEKGISGQSFVDHPPFLMQHLNRFAAPYLLVISLLLVAVAVYLFSLSGVAFLLFPLYIAALSFLLWIF